MGEVVLSQRLDSKVQIREYNVLAFGSYILFTNLHFIVHSPYYNLSHPIPGESLLLFSLFADLRKLLLKVFPYLGILNPETKNQERLKMEYIGKRAVLKWQSLRQALCLTPWLYTMNTPCLIGIDVVYTSALIQCSKLSFTLSK